MFLNKTVQTFKCGPMVFDDLPQRTKQNTILPHSFQYPAQNGFPLRCYICLHSGNQNISWQWIHAFCQYHLTLNNAKTECILGIENHLINIPFDIGAFTNQIYFAFGYNHEQIYMVLMGQLGQQQYSMRVNNLFSNVQHHEPSRVLPIFDQYWRLIPKGEQNGNWVKNIVN